MHGQLRRLTSAWLGLLVLLAVTAGSSAFDLGIGNAAINLAVAVAKTALIAAVFMHLARGSVLLRLAAAGAVFWLAILYLLALADYATR